MKFKFSSGLRGIGQAVFYGLISRVASDVEFVGLEDMFRRQHVDFTADNVYYFTNFDSKARPNKNLVFETITEIDSKGIVKKYGWASQTKADAVIKVFRENHEWILMVFLAGEMTDIIRSNPKYIKRHFNPYNKMYVETARVPMKDVSHKTKIRVPIIGEPDVSILMDIHNYISKYKG